ncbi:MAG: IS630 family transposase [candidate division Zixibacteria bacterium]|nr:IS630 family transposase [candidate division Zixibacteria bacterium]
MEGVSGPRFRVKKNRILKLYVKAPTQGVVVCFDEFGPMEIKPMAGHSWAKTAHPQRLRATYHRRQGTEQLLAFYDVHDDCLAGTIHKRKTSRDLLAAWRRLRACYPKAIRIHLILDNLSSHWHPILRDFAHRHNIRLVPTPTYASWLNAIEAHFGALKRFCLNNSDDTDHRSRRRRIYRYMTWRNKKQAHQQAALKLFRRY